MQLTKVHLVGYILCASDKNPLKPLSCVRLFVTPWAVAYQAPPSIGFSRQEYWSGLLFPSPGDPPDPGIEPVSFTLQATLYHLSHQGSPIKAEVRYPPSADSCISQECSMCPHKGETASILTIQNMADSTWLFLY